jgi:hypothetical protein
MAKKLRLDPEDLRVQGFATGEPGAARGTVRGQARGVCTEAVSCPCPSNAWACGPFTANSCDYTRAGNTCDSFPTEVDPSCMC